MSYRTKIFLAALAAAAVALAVAAGLGSWSFQRQLAARIEQTLVSQTGLAAAALDGRTGPIDIDRMADDLGLLIGVRVTIIAPDGRVVGDSEVAPADLAALENHGRRPEIVAAEGQQVGLARRYSTTLGVDMLYSARRLAPASGEHGLGWVRLALPLSGLTHELDAARRAIWPAFAIGIVAALVGAWAISRQLTRRLQAIAAAAERQAGGDAAPLLSAEGSDEIGRVARMVNESAREVRRQLAVVASDRALMAAMFSGMVEGVVVVDARGRVQLANEAAHRMLGLREQAAAAGKPAHYLETVRHPAVTEQLSRALAGETTAGAEFVMHRDPERTFVARAAPVALGDARGDDAGRGASGAVLVLHDITDLRRADRVRRDFVANVSHELRTPLTAIRGYVEALLDDPGPGDTVERRRFLEIVDRHAARMARLVKDLLRLAQLDAGQERVVPEDVPLDTLLGTLEAELSSTAERKQVSIERRVEPGAAVIRADPAKLHDILRNLLENAVNYSPSGGVVVFSASQHDRTAVLQIDDDGPGIPAADLERVFERFYRVDKARGQDPGGTGLGLAIVKHLVGLHGGAVTATNRHSRGARLTVTLPQV